MPLPAAIGDGGVSIEPWQIPRLGDGGVGSSNQREVGTRFSAGVDATPQGNSSTGIGGTFGTGTWPGKMVPAEHRGFFGGPGIRTGGAY